MPDASTLWRDTLSKLEVTISTLSYELWLKDLEAIAISGNTLILSNESDSRINAVNKNYINQIQEALSSVNDIITTVNVVYFSEAENYITNKQEKAENHRNILFNPKYTFENFVVGGSNTFVHAACIAIAENPGLKYNPLFIYGGVGLGKTHLMHSIGNYLNKTKPNLNVNYVTTEGFMNELIESIRGGNDKSTTSFREKYRNVDVLMIDDIQFISNKTSTQEEFFHTFNDLYNNNKQIIISSDRPPKDLAHLEERLRSRFQGGLIADITPPDIETRIAILQKKAEQINFSIPSDVIYYIAEQFETNIREMEGLLTKIDFYASLMNKKNITLDIAKEALKDCVNAKTETVSADKIISSVCEYFNIDKSTLIGKKRNKELIEARHICIFLIYDMLSLPLSSIGQLIGGRDHTSIMHARDNIQQKVDSDVRIKIKLNDIKNIVLNK